MTKAKNGIVFKNMLLFLGMFVIYNIPSIFLGLGNIRLFLISMALVIIGFIGFGKYQGYWAKRETIFGKGKLKWVIFGALAMRVGAALFTLLMPEMTANDQAIQDMTTDIPIVGLFFMLCVLAPIGEEILFRGLILNSISPVAQKNSRWRVAIALMISSLAFSAVHLSDSWISFGMYAFLGLVMGLVYWKTESIECAMFTHFLNNFLPFLMIAFFL